MTRKDPEEIFVLTGQTVNTIVAEVIAVHIPIYKIKFYTDRPLRKQ